MTRQQILSRMYDDAQINAQNQGWPGYIADRAKEWLIPGYWQLKLRGHLPTNLLGEDLEKDMNYGFSLSSNSQFEEWAGKRTFQLEKDNPAMAVEWIGAMMGMSNREKDINNLLTATDFIGKPLGTGVAIGAVKSFLPRDLAKMALKAGFREPVSRAAVEEGVGNIGKAASSDVAQQILDNTKGKGNPVGSIMRNLPGAFNASIDNIRNNPGRLRREGVERILQNLEEARDRIVGDAVRMQNVDKVPILSALETKTDEFLKEIADRFPEIHNNLLNNSIRFDPLLNGHWDDFYLGKTGTDLFSSKQEAERFIKSNKLLDAITDPDYAHRSIIISKPMPSEWVKDILLNTEETKTPLNWLNSLYNGFIGKIRTPEETSSAAERSAKHIVIRTGDPTSETAKSIGIAKKEFDGKRLTGEIPKGNAVVMVMGQKLGEEKVMTMGQYFQSKAGKTAEEGYKKGEVKIYEVINHHEQPFNDFSKVAKDSEGLVKYVVTKDGSEGQLKWRSLGLRPPRYDYDHTVKQPMMKWDPVAKQWNYLGDKTISVHNIRAESSNVAKAYNTIRQFLQNKDVVGAKAFHDTSGLPQSFSDIQNLFKPTITRGASGRFEKGASKANLEDPIMSVPRGKMIISLPEGQALKNKYIEQAGRDGFEDLANKGVARYIGEHYDHQDVFTTRNEGTANNPLYQIKPVDYINPVTSLNRALNRINNSFFMDVYKSFAVRHWIAEAKAGNFLNATDAQIDASPHWFFHNADSFYKQAVGDSLIKLNNLKTTNYQIKQFMGVPDSTSAWLHSLAQKLSDSLYTSGKVKLAIATESLLTKLRDPYAFLRSMTFHAKLGLFNPAQFLVQANTFTNIWGIAGPNYAAPGTKASILYSWASLTRHPEIWDKIDDLATKRLIPGTAKFAPGDFTEIATRLENSGFLKASNQQSFTDNPYL